MIQSVLKQLDSWYQEPSQGGDRPKLLSKLAVLELCGWIEGELDRQLLGAQNLGLDDEKWIRECVLDRNSGFTYGDHFRVMLTRVFGELLVRKIEMDYDQSGAGDLEQLKSILGSLWKIRCDYAHADVTANVAAQKTFQAPSWAINQHRIVSKLLLRFEQATVRALVGT